MSTSIAVAQQMIETMSCPMEPQPPKFGVADVIASMIEKISEWRAVAVSLGNDPDAAEAMVRAHYAAVMPLMRF